MKHFMLIAYILSLNLPNTKGQCNTFPIIFGSSNGDTNITVIEYSSVQSQIWVGGAVYDDKFAPGAGLSGGINDYIPYIAKYNFGDRKFLWA